MTAAKDIKSQVVTCGGCSGTGHPPWEDEFLLCDICNGVGKVLPVPGMPVSMCLKSSLYPGTITSVSSNSKEIVVLNDEVRKGRFFVPGDVSHTFTRRRDNSFRLKKHQTITLSFGIRHLRQNNKR